MSAGQFAAELLQKFREFLPMRHAGRGIAAALVVTLFGVGVSCPAIFFNAFYRNRITRVCMDVGHIADDLLTQMYHNSKKPAPPAGAVPPPPPLDSRPASMPDVRVK